MCVSISIILFPFKELIASPDLGVVDEKDVYDAVIKWIKHDPRERAVHLAGIGDEIF